MSRPRTPTKILELRGSFLKNPDRRRAGEPKPTAEIGGPPKWMDAVQRRIWRDLVQRTPPGVLTNADVIVVELAVGLIDKSRRSGLSSAERKDLISCLARMGLTPADRSRVNVRPQRPANHFSNNGRQQ